MRTETVRVQISVSWARPQSNDRPWRWGDDKSAKRDVAWSKRKVIYRWVKNSTGDIAMIGETERMLTERVDNYIHAKRDGGAGATNKKLREEQLHLEQTGDFLYLEFTDQVPGYDLSEKRERRLAESLLVGYAKPYLQ